MALVLNKCVTLSRSHPLSRTYVEVLVTQSCLTLCDPIDCSPPCSSVHGLLQARILDQVAISFSRDLPSQGLNLGLPHGKLILYHLSHQGSPLEGIMEMIMPTL